MQVAAAIRLYLVIVATAVFDQATKVVARALLTPGKPVTVIPGFFDLELVYNRGAAFGILPDWTPLLVIIGLCAVYAFVRLGRSFAVDTPHIDTPHIVPALGMLTGGAIGNLIDRFTSQERAVTDFLSFHISLAGRTYSWPSFNVADIGIVLGAVLLVLSVYAYGRRRDGK